MGQRVHLGRTLRLLEELPLIVVRIADRWKRSATGSGAIDAPSVARCVTWPARVWLSLNGHGGRDQNGATAPTDHGYTSLAFGLEECFLLGDFTLRRRISVVFAAAVLGAAVGATAFASPSLAYSSGCTTRAEGS